jgi:hypothetical protein
MYIDTSTSDDAASREKATALQVASQRHTALRGLASEAPWRGAARIAWQPLRSNAIPLA